MFRQKLPYALFVPFLKMLDCIAIWGLSCTFESILFSVLEKNRQKDSEVAQEWHMYMQEKTLSL
jgi:hypothetical protein